MTIKVFDLACETDHGFEGWFASADAFDEQSRRQLIACPICGSTQVRKLLSAPRLNLGAVAPVGDRGDPRAREHRGPAPVSQPRPVARGGEPPPGSIDPVQFQRLFLAMARKLIDATEDVGERFAEEARRIHYQEAPSRAIRGATTRDEAAELREEGIEVFALPVPESLKGPVQ